MAGPTQTDPTRSPPRGDPAPASVRVYLAPGLFGFARLAGFDYLQHVVSALSSRLETRGRPVDIQVVDVHPSASIRRRAARLAQLVEQTAGSDDGPIHLLGHSTGGLDARLVASPGARLDDSGRAVGWLDRLRSVTTLNTPHYGTPLAGFFATTQGQSLLYAVSALTLTGLRLGTPPLAITSALVASLRRGRGVAGIEIRLIEDIVDRLMNVLDEQSSLEVRTWLRKIKDDRGAILQLTPEAMDLFQAGVGERPGVRYQCVASYAPSSRVGDWVRHLRSPWSFVSAALFQLLNATTSRLDPRYPCAPAGAGEGPLRSALGQLPPQGANDGVVPLRSQLWGKPVWVGRGDHLDVVGYFRGHGAHNDWLCSGARFDRARFDLMLDAVVEGMLDAEAAPSRGR